eukprot:gnl/TRDRNA2_/TRDRNA2_166935_c2_seq1.p1 gnl/TRDRNA2_/TRDRNA2_166935_c2~~gnl/TRDRNA2_/TRDRNA2_166935_c2_seq1.p1  ORF type:complete len:440 (-),score=124.86 gnl/TRDRNA2_/TRDRNA2_166935_c2_seq1:91-1272(-)
MATHLAELNPSEGVAQIADRLVKLPFHARLGELTSEDFVAAAKAEAMATKDEEQLRRKAVELARALAATRELWVLQVEKELSGATQQVFENCGQSSEQAVAQLAQEKARCQSEKKAAMQEAVQLRIDAETAEVRALAAAEVEKRVAQMREEAHADRESRVAALSEEIAGRLAGLREPLMAAEEVFAKAQSLEGNTLSRELLALGDALVDGRPSHRQLCAVRAAGGSDGFVKRVLAKLPEEAFQDSASTRGRPSPSEPQLLRGFNDQIDSLVAVALAPPARSALGSMVSALLGRLFGCLYVARSPDEQPKGFVASPGSPTEAAQRNLEALAEARQLVGSGDLRGALFAVEGSLTGECRNRASAWIASARHALILQQAARALQAKASCCIAEELR